MKCIHCQGTMKKGSAPFHIDRRGYHLLLDSIPAWVCQQCGETYFEEREVDSIQELIKTVEEKTHDLALAEAS
jgi:YgiT-type zinc finger domain-containing protein